MTLIELLIMLVVLVSVCLLAYWIIKKFFPVPYQTYALIVVGLLALGFLIMQFFPSALNTRVGG